MHKFDIRKGTCKTISKTPARSKPAWGSLMLKFDQAKWVNTGPSSDNSSTQQQATQSKQNQSTAIANKIGLKVASQTVNNSMILKKQKLSPQLPSFSSFVTPLPQDNEERNVPSFSDFIYNLQQHGKDAPQPNESLPPILPTSQDNHLPPLGELMSEQHFNDNYAQLG